MFWPSIPSKPPNDHQTSRKYIKNFLNHAGSRSASMPTVGLRPREFWAIGWCKITSPRPVDPHTSQHLPLYTMTREKGKNAQASRSLGPTCPRAWAKPKPLHDGPLFFLLFCLDWILASCGLDFEMNLRSFELFLNELVSIPNSSLTWRLRHPKHTST